jgi:hypothetical protein
MKAYKISDKICLLQQVLSTKTSVVASVAPSTNYILVLDCSGSMSYELPKIREQLKKKLPKLLGPKDTISIIWFSGRGQCGVLLEAEPVATLTDLTQVNQAIDRWLNPLGMTGFKEPLQEVLTLIAKIKTKLPGTVFSLFFMSDGCDNQWPRGDILKAVEAAAGSLASATFVEYGYYADRPLLTAMAQAAGGQLIFAQGFDTYQPAFEAAMGKKITGAPKVEVKIPETPIGGFVYTLRDGDLVAYGVEDCKANVPEDTREFWYVVEDAHPYNDKLSNQSPKEALAAAYAAVSLYSIRMNSDLVLSLLKGLGDVDFVERFATCFGKQKYSEFMDAAKAAAFDPALRYTKGYDPTKVPAEDAYTVLDLLRLLASDDDNHILMDHPEFKYSKIGRSRIDADEVLTADEQLKVDEINAKLAKTKKASDIKALQAELAAIMDSKKGALVFTAHPAPEGYSISNLVYNESRPNVSIGVRKTGTVDLSGRLPKEADFARVPAVFPTFIFRNYAIIKDGLLNVEVIPVRVTKATADELSKVLPPEAKPTNISITGNFVTGVINLKALPIINRKMVASVSAKDLFVSQFELIRTKAAQKVYKEYLDSRFPKTASAKDKAEYGEVAAKWLLEQGFGYNGYAPPHTTQAESTDVYMGKELEVSVPGYKSLPKVAEVRDRIASKKKQTTPGVLMSEYVEEVEKYLASDEYTKAADKDAAFKVWIEAKAKGSIQKARQLMYQMACTKFSVVIGQIWFREFSSLDETTLKLKLGGNDIECSVVMKEVEIKI